MGIKAKFTKPDVHKMLRAAAEKLHLLIITNLSYIGEQFVINARNNAEFTDRTGNLRGSIGFGVFKDGKPIQMSDFSEVNKGAEGPLIGKALLESLALQYNTGYWLICVAGMEYAAAVEAKGFDVIYTSSEIAKDAIEEAIKMIKQKISAK